MQNPLKHIAIIMDGNGRWAKKRLLPRTIGHKKGIEAVKKIASYCLKQEIPYLTLFAFSSENWQRPPEEVSFLMNLFITTLSLETKNLHDNGIRLRIIGEPSTLSEGLNAIIRNTEKQTQNNDKLTLTIAINYGGRWDIIQAVNRYLKDNLSSMITDEILTKYLSTAELPEPDLFIRTGGEQRISNFLLWQLAYTELYFTNTLWPDFNEKALSLAIKAYQTRDRRFGSIR